MGSKGDDSSQRSAKTERQGEGSRVDRDIESLGRYVAPRNETEQIIADIWKELFGIDQMSIHDDYFELGGDSLLATRLFAQIGKEFNKDIPLATLFEAPTIEKLSKIVEQQEWSRAWSSLVTIRPDGLKPPLFFIHGAGGNILNYRDLASYLDSDQPIYGLQSQGLDGKQPFLTRIEDMASRYLKEIQSVWPEGPYLLAGYCMGGTIALEMAQQLHEKGKEVSLLALLETYNWRNLGSISLIQKIYYYIQKSEFHLRNLLLSDDKLTFITEKLEVARRRKKVWLEMIMSKAGHASHQDDGCYFTLSQLRQANDRAAGIYVAKPCPARITHFIPVSEYALFQGPEVGWDKLAAGGLEVHELPVYPAGMLVEPFVKLLAEKLKACIDKALKK